MSRPLARSLGLILLMGCGGQPAGWVPPNNPWPAAGPTPWNCLHEDVPRLKPVSRFQLPALHVRTYERSVQLSADGTRVALGTAPPLKDSYTQVWQLTPEPKLVFTSPSAGAGGVFALSPAGKRLLISGDVFPRAFDVDAGTSLDIPMRLHRFSHAFFRDEDVAVWTHRTHEVTKLAPGRVYVWDVARNADAGTFDIPDDRFQAAFPSRNGSELWLFQVGERFEIECYDVAAKALVRTVRPDPDEPGVPLTRAGVGHAVAPDGATFSANAMTQKIYDGTTGGVVGGLPADVYGLEEGLLLGGSRYLGRTGGTRTTGGTIDPNDLVLIDWRTGKALAVLGGFSPIPDERPHRTDADPRAGASADGKTLVVVSRLGEALVFDLSGVK